MIEKIENFKIIKTAKSRNKLKVKYVKKTKNVAKEKKLFKREE